MEYNWTVDCRIGLATIKSKNRRKYSKPNEQHKTDGHLHRSCTNRCPCIGKTPNGFRLLFCRSMKPFGGSAPKYSIKEVPCSGVHSKPICTFLREWAKSWSSSKRDNKQCFSDARVIQDVSWMAVSYACVCLEMSSGHLGGIWNRGVGHCRLLFRDTSCFEVWMIRALRLNRVPVDKWSW